MKVNEIIGWKVDAMDISESNTVSPYQAMKSVLMGVLLCPVVGVMSY